MCQEIDGALKPNPTQTQTKQVRPPPETHIYFVVVAAGRNDARMHTTPHAHNGMGNPTQIDNNTQSGGFLSLDTPFTREIRATVALQLQKV
jgi:hypothetical protein